MEEAAGGVESARSRSKTKKATNIFIPVRVNQEQQQLDEQTYMRVFIYIWISEAPSLIV